VDAEAEIEAAAKLPPEEETDYSKLLDENNEAAKEGAKKRSPQEGAADKL
jgi:hypothetical protein